MARKKGKNKKRAARPTNREMQTNPSWASKQKYKDRTKRPKNRRKYPIITTQS